MTFWVLGGDSVRQIVLEGTSANFLVVCYDTVDDQVFIRILISPL
jgi:hypothetical protein